MFGGILKKKKLKLKTKIVITMSILVSVFLVSLGLFLLLDDSLYDKVLKSTQSQEEVGEKGRPIYDATLEPTPAETTSKVTAQNMIDGGMTVQEAQVIAALEQILGGSIESKIGDYLGLKNEFRVKTIAPQLAPAICAELKYGVNCDLTLMQSISELGWNYSAAGLSKKSSRAWKYNNSHGIKVGSSKPNEYWDGASETVATHEYYGGVKVNIKDEFKAFKSLWHSYMYHSWLITQTKRYKPFKMQDVTTPTDYALKLKSAGYYTAPGSYYANLMNSIYKSNNLARVRTLYDQVVEVLNRNGGLQMTPGGQQLANGEWVPNNSSRESWGYFIDPAKGRLTSDGSVRIHPITKEKQQHNAWDYAAPKGTPIYAPRSGKVIQKVVNFGIRSYGNYITLDHGDGFYSRYAHMSKHALEKGDEVKQGDIIGYVGSTGRSTGPHVHFEIMRGGTNRDKNYVAHSNYYNGKEGSKYSLKSSKISFKDYMNIVKTSTYTGSTTDTNSSNNLNSNTSYNGGTATSSSSNGDITKVGNIVVNRTYKAKYYGSSSNRKIEYIVIHDTGVRSAGTNAKSTARYFSNPGDGRKVSAHYNVDESSIYQAVDLKDVAYHCGDKKRPGKGNANISNSNTIGIEMAVNSDGDWRKTQTNAQQLTKVLMDKYKIPLSNVVRHHDVSGKICPAKLMEEDGGWERWKRELANITGVSSSSEGAVGTTPSNQSSGSIIKRTKYAGFDWAEKWDVDLSTITNKRLSILQVADKQLGKPYVLGGNGPDVFDCSGLTSYCYKHGPGIDIPRNSNAQQRSSKFVQIPVDQAKPGDLFGRPDHVGIFLKDLNNKQFLALHASTSKKPVLVAKYPKYDRGAVKFYRLK